MKGRIIATVAALLFVNCAVYKELTPKPELMNQEQGYLELKKGKNDFSLSKGDKYFIAFPAPTDDHFYLIITSPLKRKIETSLADGLEKNSSPGKKIGDETWAPDTMCIYPVDKSKPTYFWLIDNVPDKLTLPMHYRYAPQWRVKFEHRYASYKETLAKNRVERGDYNALGTTLHLDGSNFTLVIDSVTRHTAELQKVRKELLDLQNIFPSNIMNSTDVAYLNYKKLKSELEEEIAFQNNWASVLGFFYHEYQTRGNAFNFLGYTEDFITYFSMKGNLPDHIVTESQNYLQKRLVEAPRFFDQRLQAKDDATPLDTGYFRIGALNRLPMLYSAAGLRTDPDFTAVAKFMNDFDAKCRTLGANRDSLAALVKFVKDAPGMPSDDLFRGVVARATALQSAVPTAIDQSYGKYQGFACAAGLNQEIGKFNTELLRLSGQYRTAETLVPQLNILKAQEEYGAMIGLLKQNLQLGFLLDKYRDLDRLSLGAQVKAIKAALDNNAWGRAEAALKNLHIDQNFLDPSVMAQKSSAVHDYEDSLYSKVERVTRVNVNKFLEDHVNTFENIDSLYADSVFLPVHDITFSSGSRNDLIQRKGALVADLAKMKENEFPAKAIKLLYDQFLKSPDDNGVLKARAVVAHGKHYTGDDKDVKLRMAECDPLLAKWIVKAKDYRRVFVVPVTDVRSGKNKYVVRFNIKIPTEATFPVYDLNVKLPKEVAQNALNSQWYDDLTLNRKPIKNEGRFSVTAPTAANNYEFQITPVQMNKDESNFLEITFHHNAFKVLQVSVMVQPPILKKN
jgi:hypothetical protein